MFVDKDLLIESCKKYFKEKGYKKQRNTWKKTSNDLVSCFNIQTSQWDSRDYYINVGIVLSGIENEPPEALGVWHVQQRIDHKDKQIEDILAESNSWLIKHSDLSYLRNLAEKDWDGRLPVVLTKQAIDYLNSLIIDSIRR